MNEENEELDKVQGEDIPDKNKASQLKQTGIERGYLSEIEKILSESEGEMAKLR